MKVFYISYWPKLFKILTAVYKLSSCHYSLSSPSYCSVITIRGSAGSSLPMRIFFLKWNWRKSTDPDRAAPDSDLYFILMHHSRDIHTSCCMLLYEALLLKLFILSAQQEMKVWVGGLILWRTTNEAKHLPWGAVILTTHSNLQSLLMEPQNIFKPISLKCHVTSTDKCMWL